MERNEQDYMSDLEDPNSATHQIRLDGEKGIKCSSHW